MRFSPLVGCVFLVVEDLVELDLAMSRRLTFCQFYADAEEVARFYVYMASDFASFFNGANLVRAKHHHFSMERRQFSNSESSTNTFGPTFWSHVLKNDEFCIKNDEFCIKIR